MSGILRRHAFSITFAALVLGYLLFSGSDSGESGKSGEIVRFSGYTMGTSYDVQVVDLPETITLDHASAAVADLLQRLDREIFSTYAPESELSRFNALPVNQPFSASQELFDVLEMAQEIAALSDGAFDVTVGPLVDLWGFGPDPRLPPDTVPSQADIEQAQAMTGHRYLQLQPDSRTIIKTRSISVDLSAIAKGYAVDRVGDYFDSLGVQSYFLEIGGELKMKGLKPGGLSWVPAIEAPTDVATQIYEIFFSRGEQIAVAGSGDYRNYFEQDGRRYSHEIDPRTGAPITHSLAAAYVIDNTAARADGLATALMIMGVEQSVALANSIDQPIYLIYKDDDGTFSDYVNEAFSVYLDE
ncbi:MAG: FAD:protein FMN transferase [Gammaproteobacteria bacterium]